MSHNPLAIFYHRKLDNLEQLSSLVEDALAAEAEKLDASLAATAAQYSDEEKQEFYEYHSEDFYQLADSLPTLLRYAVLTGADSGLEAFLNDTCETFANVHGVTLSLKDLRGSGIECARTYLKKVAKMPFPDTSPEWTTVIRLHELRNAIVHVDGYVVPERTELVKWAATVEGLKINEAGEISLSRTFATPALAAYRAFLKKVDKASESLNLWHSVFPPVEDAP